MDKQSAASFVLGLLGISSSAVIGVLSSNSAWTETVYNYGMISSGALVAIGGFVYLSPKRWWGKMTKDTPKGKAEITRVASSGFNTFIDATDIGEINARDNKSDAENFIKAKRVEIINATGNEHTPRGSLAGAAPTLETPPKHRRKFFGGWRP